ncbi:polysaccharide export protein [Rhodobacterales bacterium HKCCE3408]|nr:polysaccharide export protein [Rhodobacterales bacterium HKCCE3408]
MPKWNGLAYFVNHGRKNIRGSFITEKEPDVRSTASPRVRVIALFLCALTVGACGLPRLGPTRNEIFQGSVQENGDAFVVEVNQRVLEATSVIEALGFTSGFVNASGSATEVIRPGDSLTLSIYENVTDGLLAGEGQNSAVIEEVQVDEAGFIFIPYAGRVRAAGNTPNALREIITSNLAEQTPDPQVIVRRVAGDGATVSVTGGVGAQGIVPLERPTRNLTGVIAAAGGLSIEPEVARITVVRGSHRGTIWFNDLFAHPQLDIAMQGNDRVLVEEDTRTYTAIGATGQQARVPFDSQTISAMEALATVGGLNPNLGDPTGIFVLRNEPQEIAMNVLGRDDLAGTQRMIYVIDLTSPVGMFEARDFIIRDEDTLYVTTAPFAQWRQILGAFSGTLSTASSIDNLANN